MSALEVISPGPRCLVQDEGRSGYAHLGVTRSGAADLGAYRLGNRLLGNNFGVASLEVTIGGFAARAIGGVSVVVTGARGVVTIDEVPVGRCAVLYLRDGQILRIELPSSGLRHYVAVRGGFEVDSELGSRASDTLSGLGPPPVSAGIVLPIGAAAGDWPTVDFAPEPPLSRILRVILGPRDDWFTDPGALTRSEWTVTAQSDRVGLRLAGSPLTRTRSEELASEPMVVGSLQVPPDGQPIAFGVDHPVTGGYPVIAVVEDADALGQLAPGDRVRFVSR